MSPIRTNTTALAYLFAHRLRVGYGGAEEAVPLHTTVKSGPVVVSVAGVRQTPGDERVKLAISRIARLTLHTYAHTS